MEGAAQELTGVFGDAYRGKSVLVTGHTGFKGSWLSHWLVALGARVTGYSAYVPSHPSAFEVTGLERNVTHIEGDVRDEAALRRAFEAARPDVVFHLAAQPIVRASYAEPKRTFDVNVGGTVNVLECLRALPGTRAAVLITSDKCYENVEWVWGYRETDRLGGEDPYSASKAAAEVAAHAYVRSFFRDEASTRIATARAGNVIGGGDWALDRIVPDCFRAWSAGREVVLRNPRATRPWQHVLEPLSGYLWLGAQLLDGREHGEAFNFGPAAGFDRSVEEVVRGLARHWPGAAWRVEAPPDGRPESTLLKLSIDKAMARLAWQPTLGFEETLAATAAWYRAHEERGRDMALFTRRQIDEFAATAAKAGARWALG